jgi:MoaA/NifB/PqqE/SkfB family radical SAM enzyme
MGEDTSTATLDDTSTATLGTTSVELNMDLVRKLYQKSVHPDVLRVAHGERLSAPMIIDLDPTTLCDLACPECISSNVLNSGQVSRDRIERFAEELTRTPVRAVILIGGGEPLLHRSIGTVIDTLHGAGIELGLVTNGTLIGRYLDRLADKVSWVRVSMDAGTPDTYAKFRPSRRKEPVFPIIIDNMRRLAERKRGKLGYSFLLMQRFDAEGRLTDTNYPEVYEAGELARDIGCDYFEIKAMLDDNHFTVNQRAEDIALVEEQLARLAKLEDGSFHVLSSSNWEGVRNNLDPVQPKEYTTCRVAELRTNVTPNGVFICPYHRGNAKGRIGDITDTPFDEVWAKADTTVINPREDCQFLCARHPTNVEIASLSRRTRPATLIDDYDPFI